MKNIFHCYLNVENQVFFIGNWLLNLNCELLCHCDSVLWAFFSRAPVFFSIRLQYVLYFLCRHLITVSSEKYVMRFCNSLT